MIIVLGFPAVLGIVLSAATLRRNGRNSVLTLIGSLVLLAAALGSTFLVELWGVGVAVGLVGLVLLFLGALLPQRVPGPVPWPGPTPSPFPGPGPFPGPTGPYVGGPYGSVPPPVPAPWAPGSDVTPGEVRP